MYLSGNVRNIVMHNQDGLAKDMTVIVLIFHGKAKFMFIGSNYN